MPHIVKKTYLFSYIALCLSAPLIFIFSDFEVTASNENYREDFSSTVTTTLISSVVGDTFCTGDEVTFTAYPTGANNYSFYINGILKQGPSSLNTFIPTGALFNEDQITVTLEKNNDVGIDLVTIFENKIEDPGKIYFKDESDGLEELTVCYGSDSVNLESYRAASVNGILLASFDTRYQWMSSSDKVNWFAIIGANRANYTPPKLTATTFFRRDVISDLNGTVCRSQSNILKMEVEVELMGGTISPNGQTLCEGEISEELKVENGVIGRTVTYQWQKSLDNIVFTDIPMNAKSMSYFSGTLTQTTYYRRITNAVSGTCEPQPSSVHKIDVIDLDPGVFDPAHSTTICYDSAPVEFSTSPLSIGQPGKEVNSSNAFLTFIWEKSTDNGSSWQSIEDATERNYYPPPLKTSTWFRRKVTATLNGVSCEKITENIIKINVLPEINKGSIHTNQEICVGEIPSRLELRNLTPLPGLTYSFQWQSSVKSFPFEDIEGENSTDLVFLDDDSLIPDETTRYRVKITDITIANCDPVYSDVVTITVRPLQKILQVGGPIDRQIICLDSDITPIVFQYEGSATDIDLSDVTTKGLNISFNPTDKQYTITGSVTATTNLNIISTGPYCNPDFLVYKIDVKGALAVTEPDFIYADDLNTHQPEGQVSSYNICEGTETTQFSADFIDPEKLEYTEFQWEIVSPAHAGYLDPNSGLMTWNTSPPAFDGRAYFRVRSNGCDTSSDWRDFDMYVIPNQFPPDVVNKITNPIQVRIIEDVEGYSTGYEPVCRVDDSTLDTQFYIDDGGDIFNMGIAVWTIETVNAGNPDVTIAGTIDSFSGRVDWNPGFWGTVNIYAHPSNCAGFNHPENGTPDPDLYQKYTVIIPEGPPEITDISVATTGAGNSLPQCPIQDGQITQFETNYSYENIENPIVWSINNTKAGTIDSNSGILTWQEGFFGEVRVIARSVKLEASCQVSENSLLVVIPEASSITLASGFNTNNAKLCQNSNLSPITYTIGGAAAGVNHFGLPDGLKGEYNSNNQVSKFSFNGTSSTAGEVYDVYIAEIKYSYTTQAAGETAANIAAEFYEMTKNDPNVTASQNNNELSIRARKEGYAFTVTTSRSGNSPQLTFSTVETINEHREFKISGNPTAAPGTYYYTLETISIAEGCTTAIATGTIIIDPDSAIHLDSGSNNDQTVCNNSPIAPIVYNIENADEAYVETPLVGADFTEGLPDGVNFTFTGKQIIISGTPEVTITTTTTFIFTVQTKDVVSGCEEASVIGKITVVPNLQVSIDSRPYTQNQQVCVGEPIEEIVYRLSNPADENSNNLSYNFSGLPDGVSGTYDESNREIRLSGTPEPNPPISETTIYTYSITANNCEGVSYISSGTITVNPRPYVELISEVGIDAQILCSNKPLNPIKYQIQGASAYDFSISPSAPWVKHSFDPSVNQVTIIGAPDVKLSRETTFTYTISPKYINYECDDSKNIQGTITLIPEQEMILTTGSGLMNQEMCEGEDFQSLRFDFMGSAIGAYVTGLPAGLGGNLETFLQKTKIQIGTGSIMSAGEKYTIRLNNTDFTYFTNAGDMGSSSALSNALRNLIDDSESYECELEGKDLIISSTVSGVRFDVQMETESNSLNIGPITEISPASQYVISGSPLFESTLPVSYTYTIISIGTSCNSHTVTGTIKLNPKSTIILDSPLFTDDQLVCDGQEINDIVYQLGDGVNGATLLGAPPGISGNFDPDTKKFTLSGTVESGVTAHTVYNMIITTTANSYSCEEATALAKIQVTPKETLQLLSPKETENQSICGTESGTPITEIIYQLGGAATGYNISGLPIGINSEYDPVNRQITISGTSSNVLETTNFEYTIITTGSSCGAASATGIIQVLPRPNLILKSDIETTQQTQFNAVCDGVEIQPIVYEIGDGAKGAFAVGLPNGLNTSLNGNIFTISGKTNTSNSNSEIFEFTVEPIGGVCSSDAKLTGRIQVNPIPSVDKDYIMDNDVTHVSCFGGNDGAITIPSDSPDFNLRVLGQPNGVRQTDLLSLQNDPNILDQITINIDGIDYQHTVVPTSVGGSPQNITQLTQSLVEKINEAAASNQSNVEAVFESPSDILLRAKTIGVSFTVSTSVAPASSSTTVSYTNITQNLGSKYSYQWSGPDGFLSSNLSISNLFAGTYILSVKINECQGEETVFEIKEPEQIEMDILTCENTFLGSISGGEAPFTVELFDINDVFLDTKTVNKDVIYSSLIPGEKYKLKIKGVSCSVKSIFIVEMPLGFQFENEKVEIVHDYCNQSPDIGNGYIKLGGGALGNAFSGGSNQFSYSWIGPDNQGFNTRDIYNLVPGNYTVTVKDEVLGCEESQSFVINATNPILIDLDLNNKIDANGEFNLNCYGDSDASISTLVSGGSGSFSFSWTKDNTVVPNLNSAKISGLSAGVYELTVTDNPPTGLSPQPPPCQVSKKFVVNQPDKFSVIMSKTSSFTLCSGDRTSLAFEIFGGTPPFDFELNGESYSKTERKFLIENLNPMETGPTYNAVFSDANGCTPENQPDSITFPNLTNVELNGAVEPVDCNNGKQGSIIISTVNNTQITEPTLTQIHWISATLNQYDSWENSKGKLENITQPGKYKVKITDKNGCELYNEEFIVEALGGQLTLDELDVTQEGCAGESNKIELAISGGKPPYQIIWQQFKGVETNESDSNGSTSSQVVSSTTSTTDSTNLTVTNYEWVTLTEHNNKGLIADLETGSYRAIISDQSNLIDGNQCGGTITTKNIIIGEADIQLKNFRSILSKDCDPSEQEVSIEFNLFNNLYDEFDNIANITIRLDNVIMDGKNENIEGPGNDGLYVIKNIKPGNHSLNISNNVDPDCELIYPFEISERSPIVYSGLTEVNLEECEEYTTIDVSGSQVSGGSPFDLNGQLTYNFEWNYTDLTGNVKKYLGSEIIQAYPGKYELKILDSNNCTSENPIIINVNSDRETKGPIKISGALVHPTNPNELLKVIPPQCSSDSFSGQIGIEVTGGISPYSIKWYFESSQTGGTSQTSSVYEELKSFQNATIISNLKSGRYRLVIESNADSCNEEKNEFNFYTEDIIVPANQDFFIEDGPTPRYDNLCKGEPGELLISVFDKNEGDLTFYYNESIVNSEKVESSGVADVYVLSIVQPVKKAILKITNANNCSIEKEVNLLELGNPNFKYSSPSFEANGETSVLAREEVTFTNTSEEPYLYSTWSFGDGSEQLKLHRVIDGSVNIRHIYGISGTYFVTLRIENALGCEKEISKKITVGKGFNILAPNVFTPNNDGINDRYRIIFSGFESLSFSVFDNHGNLLYNEKVSEPNRNSPKGLELEGWDGNDGSSETPYFIYSIEGVLLSDSETKIERSGVFSMLR